MSTSTHGIRERVPATMTVDEAARVLGISRGLAYEGAHRGEIPVIRVGRRMLVPRGALLALVAAETTGLPARAVSKTLDSSSES